MKTSTVKRTYDEPMAYDCIGKYTMTIVDQVYNTQHIEQPMYIINNVKGIQRMKDPSKLFINDDISCRIIFDAFDYINQQYAINILRADPYKIKPTLGYPSIHFENVHTPPSSSRKILTKIGIRPVMGPMNTMSFEVFAV